MRITGGGVAAPTGFSANGLHSGVKASKKKDLSLILSDRPCLAAGSFTTNKIQAACVTYNKKMLKKATCRAVVANSGNANCLTGASGMANTRKIAEVVAQELSIYPEDVLVGSTGVIGVKLPVEKIVRCIPALVKGLRKDGSLDAAQGILTTDRITKEMAVEFKVGGKSVRVGAIAKGSGMIHPHMELSDQKSATMLCYITTDAVIAQSALRSSMQKALEKTFNLISVDGDQSTNDMVIAMANGAAQNRLIKEGTKEYRDFAKAIYMISQKLAKLIVVDAEGGTKFCEITVKNASSGKDARDVLKSVMSSQLVKTALFGSDPNWGRIAASVGSSGVDIDPQRLQIKFGSETVMRHGARINCNTQKLSRIAAKKNIRITVDLGTGKHQFTGWTSDLSTGYVRINSAYRT